MYAECCCCCCNALQSIEIGMAELANSKTFHIESFSSFSLEITRQKDDFTSSSDTSAARNYDETTHSKRF